MAAVTRELPQGHSGKRNLRAGKRKPRSSPSASNGRAESSGGLVLPSQENVPPSDLSESMIFIHGEKAVGKTSLAAQFQDALVFMFERGRRNLPIYQVPGPKQSLDWESFKEYVELFLSSEFQTGVIDTIDGCYLACLRWVCQQHDITDPDGHSSPYIIWDEVAAEFGALIHLIQQSGKGLILVSHSKPRPLVAKRKGLKRDELEEAVMTYERMEPTCKPAAFKVVQEMADFVFFYGYRDGHRAITVRSPLNIYWTACGLGDRFLDPDGNPIETFKVGASPQLAYQALLDAYDNKLYDIDYVAPPSESSSSRSIPSRTRRRR